jgi:predicted DNA-binding protein (UPF0251 family)
MRGSVPSRSAFSPEAATITSRDIVALDEEYLEKARLSHIRDGKWKADMSLEIQRAWSSEELPHRWIGFEI